MHTTIHEIKWRIAEITKRINDDRIFEMRIRGIPTEAAEEQAENIELDDKEKDAMERARQEALERKAREFRKKASNGQKTHD